MVITALDGQTKLLIQLTMTAWAVSLEMAVIKVMVITEAAVAQVGLVTDKVVPHGLLAI